MSSFAFAQKNRAPRRRRFIIERLEMRRLLAVDSVDVVGDGDGDFETDPKLLNAFHGPVLPGRPMHPIQAFIPKAVDAAVSGEETAFDPSFPAPTSRLSLDQTFQLHSRPDSNFTIYLDFDGHVTSGTSWNGGYNLDEIVHPNWWGGTGANLSNTRLQLIQDVWKIVAEDFAPFDVNVTTEEPLDLDDLRYSGSTDTRWGTRAVMTKDTFADCGCGGHAYLGSFDDRQDEPALIYNGGRDVGSETITHEIGHQFGLRHDGDATREYYRGHGSGTTGWGPIMGAPFSKKITQWNNGDYFQASRPNQDDLAVLTGSTNLRYRPDDHADFFSAATPLRESSTVNLQAFGVIERNDDVDWFRFVTGGGDVSLNIEGLGYKPNLDLWAGLFDSSGAFLFDSNPQDALSASFQNITLEAGEYFIKIDGVARDGFYDPILGRYVEPDPPPYTVAGPLGYSDYGSLGQYRITGTVTPTAAATVSITAATATVTEGDIAEVTLTSSDGGDTEVLIEIRSAAQVAPGQPAPDGIEPADVAAATTQTVTLVDGAATVQIPIVEDALVERNEALEVVIVDAGSHRVADRVATIQVIESRSSFAIFPDQPGGREGDGGASTQTFTIRRLGRSDARQLVGWRRIAEGTHPADAADFVSADEGSITFEPGDVQATLDVQINGDIIAEPDETYAIELFVPGGETFAIEPSRATAAGEIRDDESIISLPPTPVTFSEDDGGSVVRTLTITRSGFVDKPVSVDWSITATGSSPVDADDFVGGLPSGTLQFAAGETSALIEIVLAGDIVVEDDETFLLTLSNHSGGPIDGDTLVGLIRNDDFDGPEIQVLGLQDAVIADGDLLPTPGDGTDFGLARVDGEPVTRTFQIENIGTIDLNLESVTLTGSHADDFTIVPAGQTVVPPGQTTAVGVALAASVAGRRDAELVIVNDDPDEAVYNFALTGLATDLQVQEVLINEGRSSRSQIESIRVTFNRLVDHQSLARAFQVQQLGDGQFFPSLSVAAGDVDDRTEVTLTFAGEPGSSPDGFGGAFPDGYFSLRVSSSTIATPGDDPLPMYEDYVFGGDAGDINPDDTFFRLYGDSDGDADVDARDFAVFAQAFPSDPSVAAFDALLDHERDGDIDSRDLSELRLRFGKRLK